VALPRDKTQPAEIKGLLSDLERKVKSSTLSSQMLVQYPAFHGAFQGFESKYEKQLVEITLPAKLHGRKQT
jgi:hypothetical protein